MQLNDSEKVVLFSHRADSKLAASQINNDKNHHNNSNI